MDHEAASRLLARAAGRKVVIAGDLMLDHFIWGTVERISPEAPVPVVRVTRESFHPGGACNVAANIVALGGVAMPAGVIGNDPAAGRLRETLATLGVSSGGVLEAPGRATTVKTRIVAHSQQVVRFDREEETPLPSDTAAALAARTLEMIAGADALVISDYEKGCVTADLLSKLLPAAAARKIPIVVDPKPGHWRSYAPITAITPNQSEASRMTGITMRSEEDAIAAGKAILGALGCQAVLLTRGDKGVLLVEKGGAPLSIAATSRQVYDVTGAGDTVAAALALGLASGASLREAAVLANAAAGVVVSKVGTATASPQEILAVL